jgi:transposase-like protein
MQSATCPLCDSVKVRITGELRELGLTVYACHACYVQFTIDNAPVRQLSLVEGQTADDRAERFLSKVFGRSPLTN